MTPKQLKQLRADVAAYGIRTLARDSGVARATLQLIKRGVTTPLPETVAKIRAAMEAKR